MTDRYDLVVRGGTVVTVDDSRPCDVGVRDGRVVALAEGLGPGDQEVDASGQLVLPGGVDAHCHVDQKSSSGLMTADDFYTAGVSAACGGTTTIVPFAAQHRGDSLREVVRDYQERARSRAFVDYAFHLIVSDPSERVLGEELPELIREGHSSFKIYLTYDSMRLSDRQTLEVLDLARREGGLVMVHAENGDAIAWLTEGLLRRGQTAPKYHPASRPPIVEREATARVLALAELVGAEVLIVHVSCAGALEEIRRARGRGVRAHAETCPQYLLLAAADLDLPGFEGAKLMCSPPPREVEDQEALWRGLLDGDIDVFASDHAPYRYDDPKGKKAHGEQAPFTKVPNGMPGLETRLSILFSEGVVKRGLDLHRFVALTATTPARLYGLYPQKGTIAVGSDADLALWDRGAETTITASSMHDAMDYTPFEGLRLTGAPVTTVSRGELVWSGGKVAGEPGRGRLAQRSSRNRPNPDPGDANSR